MPAMLPYDPTAGLLVAAVGGAIAALAIAAVWFGRRRHSRSLGIAVVIASLALLLASAGVGYVVVSQYVGFNTWTFTYSVDIRGNGTGPESVVVPASTDGSLLDGLALTSGAANWSLVPTQHGRGLYIEFSGHASLSVELHQYPPPQPIPDGYPTMTNLSFEASGSVPVWIFYPGSTGLSLTIRGTALNFTGYVRPGWAEYIALVAPKPL